MGGAVPLDSGFYVVRQADDDFAAALERQDSIVLIKGARQVGKTSLLARGLEQARRRDARVVLTDFQSLGRCFTGFPERLLPDSRRDHRRAAGPRGAARREVARGPEPEYQLERYLRRDVLARIPSAIVWGLDEADRIFTAASPARFSACSAPGTTSARSIRRAPGSA